MTNLMRRASIVVMLVIFSYLSTASVDVPLAWETVTLTIEQHGGAIVTASRTREGHLAALSVSILGTELDIPRSCLPGDLPAYLNLINLSYGEFNDGVPYWRLDIGVDYEAAFDGVGIYHLILLEDSVKLAYIEYAESELVLIDGPVLCGSW